MRSNDPTKNPGNVPESAQPASSSGFPIPKKDFIYPLPKTNFTLSATLGFDEAEKKQYYIVEYISNKDFTKTGSQARIYNDRLTNADGSSDLPDTSPLRAILADVIEKFDIGSAIIASEIRPYTVRPYTERSQLVEPTKKPYFKLGQNYLINLSIATDEQNKPYYKINFYDTSWLTGPKRTKEFLRLYPQKTPEIAKQLGVTEIRRIIAYFEIEKSIDLASFSQPLASEKELEKKLNEYGVTRVIDKEYMRNCIKIITVQDENIYVNKNGTVEDSTGKTITPDHPFHKQLPNIRNILELVGMQDFLERNVPAAAAITAAGIFGGNPHGNMNRDLLSLIDEVVAYKGKNSSNESTCHAASQLEEILRKLQSSQGADAVTIKSALENGSTASLENSELKDLYEKAVKLIDALYLNSTTEAKPR